jgi:biotin operon repressor
MMNAMRGYDDWLIAGEPGSAAEAPAPSPADLLLMHLQADHRGRDNAGSRAHLCGETGLPDRTLRKAIEELREDGHPIGVGPRSGYYYATDIHEQREALAQYDTSLYRRLQVRNRMARGIPGATGLQLVLIDAGGQGVLV